MDVKLLHCVIHGFEKDQHLQIGNVHHTHVLLDTNAEPVVVLVKSVAGLMGKRAVSQLWGRFDDQNRGGIFPMQFSASVADIETNKVFLTLTQTLLDELVAQAATSPLATGGHVLCAMYEDDQEKRTLLVAIVKQRGGIQLDANFVPKAVTEIDLTKLHQACQIHIDDYLDAQDAPGGGDGGHGGDEDDKDRKRPPSTVLTSPIINALLNRDVPGQQFVHPIHRMVGDHRQHMA